LADLATVDSIGWIKFDVRELQRRKSKKTIDAIEAE
jgi:glycerol-3-phosphate O-acyltransferase